MLSSAGENNQRDSGHENPGEETSHHSKDVNNENARALRGRTHPSRLLERRLRRATARGDAAMVEKMLRGEACLWPHRVLRGAFKYAARAADAATIVAFARARPDFFHGVEGATPALVYAVQNDCEEAVQCLLAAGASPDARSETGVRALHWACAWGHGGCASALLAAGADPNGPALGLQPLHIASHEGHTECVLALLAAGAAPGEADACGWTPLHHAATRGRAPCVRALLDAGVEVECRGPGDHTALHLSARGYPFVYLPFEIRGRWCDDTPDYLQCIVLLLERGADVHSSISYHLTPYHLAMEHGNSGALRLLGAAGADVKTRNKDGDTALHVIAAGCIDAEESIQSLVAMGLDVNSRNNNGSTPLLRAILNWNIGAVRTLLRLGADVGQSDSNGKLPLHLAAARDNMAGLHALLEAGADPNLRAPNGAMALHVVTSAEALEALIEAGATLEARRNDGRTPFLCAALGWNVECLDAFAALGANLQARDNRGWTAVHIAASETALDSLEWLLARGAATEDAGVAEALGPAARTAGGATPLHVAAERGQAEAARALLRRKAPVAAVDAEGRTALHIAARGASAVTLRILLESARGGDRVRTARDIHGDSAAQLAHVPEMRRTLERWGLAA